MVELHTEQESLESLLQAFLASDEFANRMRFIYDKYGVSKSEEKTSIRGELGVWAEAARRYRDELDRNPQNRAAWVNYGHALKEQGLLEVAEGAYRRALEFDDSVADTHIHLGDLLRRCDRPVEAEKAYVAAYRLDPNSHAAAARLRSLSPEAASCAFDTGRFASGEESREAIPDRWEQRRKVLYAAGLPARVQSRSDPTPTRLKLDAQSRRPPLPNAARGLALLATRNFLPFAKLTAQSFQAHHPDFEVFLLLVDGGEEDAADFGEGRLVMLSDLDIADAGWFAAKFTAAEFANALKPTFLQLLASFVERVIYLDCDIAVFSRLTELVELVDVHDIVLIPHMLTPLPQPEHYRTTPNRRDIFNSGLINAGCFAIDLRETQQFLNFWEGAVLAPGAFFDEAGYQTDQQYLNWAMVNVPITRSCARRGTTWLIGICTNAIC